MQNSGFCLAWIDGYERMTRCTCSHGRDLNRFSEPQIDRSVKYINSKGREEDIYIPTVQEALTEEAFAIFRAEKIAEVRERKEAREMEETK